MPRVPLPAALAPGPPLRCAAVDDKMGVAVKDDEDKMGVAVKDDVPPVMPTPRTAPFDRSLA